MLTAGWLAPATDELERDLHRAGREPDRRLQHATSARRATPASDAADERPRSRPAASTSRFFDPELGTASAAVRPLGAARAAVRRSATSARATTSTASRPRPRPTAAAFIICPHNPSEDCQLFARTCETDADCAEIVPGTRCAVTAAIPYCHSPGEARDDAYSVDRDTTGVEQPGAARRAGQRQPERVGVRRSAPQHHQRVRRRRAAAVRGRPRRRMPGRRPRRAARSASPDRGHLRRARRRRLRLRRHLHLHGGPRRRRDRHRHRARRGGVRLRRRHRRQQRAVRHRREQRPAGHAARRQGHGRPDRRRVRALQRALLLQRVLRRRVHRGARGVRRPQPRQRRRLQRVLHARERVRRRRRPEGVEQCDDGNTAERRRLQRRTARMPSCGDGNVDVQRGETVRRRQHRGRRRLQQHLPDRDRLRQRHRRDRRGLRRRQHDRRRRLQRDLHGRERLRQRHRRGQRGVRRRRASAAARWSTGEQIMCINAQPSAPDICLCENYCGDGRIGGLEECDDGAAGSATCRGAAPTVGEPCTRDPLRRRHRGRRPRPATTATPTRADGCTNACTVVAVCGNGTVEGSEAVRRRQQRRGRRLQLGLHATRPPCAATARSTSTSSATTATPSGRRLQRDLPDSRAAAAATAASTPASSATTATPSPATAAARPASSSCAATASVDSGEQCDDGNNVRGDGCSALCRTEVE